RRRFVGGQRFDLDRFAFWRALLRAVSESPVQVVAIAEYLGEQSHVRAPRLRRQPSHERSRRRAGVITVACARAIDRTRWGRTDRTNERDPTTLANDPATRRVNVVIAARLIDGTGAGAGQRCSLGRRAPRPTQSPSNLWLRAAVARVIFSSLARGSHRAERSRAKV